MSHLDFSLTVLFEINFLENETKKLFLHTLAIVYFFHANQETNIFFRKRPAP